jgi:hypothetical protein
MMYGTTEYWSPEVCQEFLMANDLPRDMWALGVTIIEFVYLQYPFSTKPDPNYMGGNLDQAHTKALATSIQKFLSNTTEGISNSSFYLIFSRLNRIETKFCFPKKL